jgi:integrase
MVGYNIQWCEGKRRHTIYLSGRTYRQKTAERFREMVETLVYYRKNGTHVPDRAVTNWLTTAPVELQEKLAKVGLITVTKAKTCQELWDTYLKHKKNEVKYSTYSVYRRVGDIFLESFSPNEHIGKLTTEKFLEWKASLLAQDYSVATVAGYLQVARTVFRWAVDNDWVPKNPLVKIPLGSFINRENDRIITREEYAKMLDACPHQGWRTLIALARIGGLRCPSELMQLRWTDVNWEQSRFLVHSPKTERYVLHRERTVPLFPELRVELDRLFSLAETKSSEFVIQWYQGTSWQLMHQFRRITKQAGLGILVRPFDNMRMSRSNEVLARWGQAKESLWIGHSVKVMRDHYLTLSDSDFSEASGVHGG